MPIPQFHENKAKVIQLIPCDRMTECTVEQIVDVPVHSFTRTLLEETTVRSVGIPMRHTGSVKRRFQDTGFGFITTDDGRDDVFIHWKELFEIEGLQPGDTVSQDTEYDDRKGK